MRSPTLLRIHPRHLHSNVCCTGQQLDSILQALPVRLSELDWFFADVETNDCTQEWPSEPLPHPTFVGSLLELRKRSRNTNQFLSGVFLAAPSRLAPLAQWWTEDEPFRSLQGAAVEIRAFDTTYFELYGLSGDEVQDLISTRGGEELTPAQV